MAIRMRPVINGIQQIGIGVADVNAAFKWYQKVFGTDILLFKDAATATLMQQYTGNAPHDRLAILAINLQGGGGIEIWQYTSRQPQPSPHPIALGDYGIFATKIKCRNAQNVYNRYQQLGIKLLCTPCKNPLGDSHFYIKDPYENVFEIIEDSNWFTNTSALTGGVSGIVCGVSCMEKSITFYRNILGYSKILYSGEEEFTDWTCLNGGSKSFKRVLLSQNRKIVGAFSKLLGPTTIELVEVKNRQGSMIFKDRYWGDMGFIHVCYDIARMQLQENICFDYGYPFTVNSNNSFDMGNAAGQFAYNEDPDGTLIEYVETHKVPVFKKLGLYLNLQKRNPEKPLPDWMVKCLAFNRVKNKN